MRYDDVEVIYVSTNKNTKQILKHVLLIYQSRKYIFSPKQGKNLVFLLQDVFFVLLKINDFDKRFFFRNTINLFTRLLITLYIKNDGITFKS